MSGYYMCIGQLTFKVIGDQYQLVIKNNLFTIALVIGY